MQVRRVSRTRKRKLCHYPLDTSNQWFLVCIHWSCLGNGEGFSGTNTLSPGP